MATESRLFISWSRKCRSTSRVRFMLSAERCRSSMKKTTVRPRTVARFVDGVGLDASALLRVVSWASRSVPAVTRSKKLIGRGLPSTVNSNCPRSRPSTKWPFLSTTVMAVCTRFGVDADDVVGRGLGWLLRNRRSVGEIEKRSETQDKPHRSHRGLVSELHRKYGSRTQA